MREIKFRYWDKTKKRWMNYDEIFIDQEGVIYVIEERTWAYQSYMHKENISEEIEIMQYTGLKDKSGKEIYEGDILRVWQEDEYIPNRDSGGGIIDYDWEKGFSQIGKVGFKGCSFDYSIIKTVDGKHEEIHAPIDWLNNYEVIGNIYENPELIKD